jgi:hypothetical protein
VAGVRGRFGTGAPAAQGPYLVPYRSVAAGQSVGEGRVPAVKAVEDERLRRLYEGRWVMSRAWIIQYTGAAASTVARWCAERGQRPEHLRRPEPVCTVGRTIYFDQQAVEAFWAAWQEDVGTAQLGSGRRPGDEQGTRGGGPGREQRERAVATFVRSSTTVTGIPLDRSSAASHNPTGLPPAMTTCCSSTNLPLLGR